MKPDGDGISPLNLGDLDLTTDEFILDEVDSRSTSSLTIFLMVSVLHWCRELVETRTQTNCSLCLPVHIQANLEDDLVKEALKTVRGLQLLYGYAILKRLFIF